jgi:hypothetical protein
VCIFVRTDQYFSKIDISHHCKGQDFEMYASQVVTKTSNLILLSVYTAFSGEVNEFLRRLDAVLKYLFNKKISVYKL